MFCESPYDWDFEGTYTYSIETLYVSNNKYVTYQDSEGNTRHKVETLVAMGTIAGDAADDAVLADD